MLIMFPKVKICLTQHGFIAVPPKPPSVTKVSNFKSV